MEFTNKDKELRELEEKSKIKHEKYKPQTIIKCQKCGSTKSLMKTRNNGEDFWFCKNCVLERARKIKKEGK